MQTLPLRKDLKRYLAKRGLVKKFQKQKGLFEKNPHHPSLHTEILEPKEEKVYSFRINRKYRALFFYIGKGKVEIIDINPHYQK